MQQQERLAAATAMMVSQDSHAAEGYPAYSSGLCEATRGPALDIAVTDEAMTRTFALVGELDLTTVEQVEAAVRSGWR
jgi:hypothetical protein